MVQVCKKTFDVDKINKMLQLSSQNKLLLLTKNNKNAAGLQNKILLPIKQ